MNGEPKYAERSKELIKVIRNLGSQGEEQPPKKEREQKQEKGGRRN